MRSTPTPAPSSRPSTTTTTEITDNQRPACAKNCSGRAFLSPGGACEDFDEPVKWSQHQGTRKGSSYENVQENRRLPAGGSCCAVSVCLRPGPGHADARGHRRGNGNENDHRRAGPRSHRPGHRREDNPPRQHPEDDNLPRPRGQGGRLQRHGPREGDAARGLRLCEQRALGRCAHRRHGRGRKHQLLSRADDTRRARRHILHRDQRRGRRHSGQDQHPRRGRQPGDALRQGL